MLRTRALEERSIKMSKSGEAYFWIGGPGEEAFNVCLGLQVHKGRGPAFDYLHLHYRNAGVMLAMGMPMIDHVRQLAMRATDPHSPRPQLRRPLRRPGVERRAGDERDRGAVRDGPRHGARAEAARARTASEGITVVVGGEAGTAEGDFETCLNWSTRPGNELPVLMLVTNNRYGISTDLDTVHAEQPVADRAIPYGIRAETVDGNDPVAIWHAHRPGDAVLPARAQAVPARSDGEPAARPLVEQRRAAELERGRPAGAVRAEADRRRGDRRRRA